MSEIKEGLRHLDGRVAALLAGREIPVISKCMGKNRQRSTNQGSGDENPCADRVEIIPVVVNIDGETRKLSPEEIAEGVEPGDVVIRQSPKSTRRLRPETVDYYGAGDMASGHWSP